MSIMDYFNIFFTNGFQVSAHALFYLINSSIIFLICLGVSYLLFQKKIKRIAELVLYTAYTICLLIASAFIFGIFHQFDKFGSIIFIMAFALITIVIAFYKNFSFKEGLTFFQAVDNQKSLLKAYFIFIIFAIFFNLSIFQTNLPYTVSAMTDDFYRHNLMINDANIYPFKKELSSNFKTALEQNNFSLILPYPKGVHYISAFFNLILPSSFITPIEYIFTIFAILLVSIIAYAKIKRAVWADYLPLILAPGFTYLILSDHFPAGLVALPMFLLTVSALEKEKKYFSFLNILIIMLSFFVIYYFSFVLLIPILLVICSFNFLIKNWKNFSKIFKIIIITVLTLIFSFTMTLIIKEKGHFLQAVGMSETGVITTGPKTAFGIVEPFYRGTTPLFFQIIIYFYLLITVINIVYTVIKDHKNKLNNFFILSVFLIWTLIVLPMLASAPYIAMRFHILALTVSIVYLINNENFGFPFLPKSNRLIINILGTLVIVFYLFCSFEIINDRTYTLNYKIKIDYLTAVDMSLKIPSGSKVLYVGDFMRGSVLNLFFRNQYQFINVPLNKGDWSNNFNIPELKEADYLITNNKYEEIYPKFLLEKVYENKEKNWLIFKIINHDYSPISAETIETEYLALGYKSLKRNCYFYGQKEKWLTKNMQVDTIVYQLPLDETNYQTNLAEDDCEEIVKVKAE